VKHPIIAALAGALACSATVHAEPFVPLSDGQVIERLPYKAADPAVARLRAARTRLLREPENLRLAVRLAREYVELSRTTGDPRYTGYAQAALMPWWNLARPPQDVLLLRATLHQRVHEFNAALVDLETLLAINPFSAQARLTRAAVLQVQGRYAQAVDECTALQRLADQLIGAACLANVQSVSGKLHASYELLRAALERSPDANPPVRSWVHTSLAEMAVHADVPSDAEAHFRTALTLDPSDPYLLGAYADFLLDQGRPTEVVALLKDRTRADPLLLRYALALKAVGSADFPSQTDQLRARFQASRLRGDRVHLREEARFTLHLLGDGKSAVALAQANWSIQKEVADVRILLEAGLAAHDASAVAAVMQWLRETRLEDVQISRLTDADSHPL
jgi:tetratricopeptide (TPR) repeat protein